MLFLYLAGQNLSQSSRDHVGLLARQRLRIQGYGVRVFGECTHLYPDIAGLEFVNDLVARLAESGIETNNSAGMGLTRFTWEAAFRRHSRNPGEVFDPVLDDHLVPFEHRVFILMQRVLDGGEHSGEFFLADFQRSTDALRWR